MEEEDTIELIDLLRVVWKWKWFIIMFTLACAIVAGIISFSMQKIYEVSMVIEPGVIDIRPDGKFIYLDSSLNIKSKIDSQAYNSNIFKRLNADPKKLKLNFKSILSKGSNTLKIRLEMEDINIGIQSLSALFNELAKEYQHYIDSRKSDLDQEIALNKRRLDVSAGEKNHIEQEISIVKANTDKVIKERSALLQNGGTSPDKLSLLIYTNIVQQNVAHYNDLYRQLSTLMTTIETMKYKMETLKIKKQSVESIKLIQPAQPSIYPIKPKKKLNVMLAFVVGLFLSLFLAFFLEYLQKMKVHPNSMPTKDQRSSFENQEH